MRFRRDRASLDAVEKVVLERPWRFRYVPQIGQAPLYLLMSVALAVGLTALDRKADENRRIIVGVCAELQDDRDNFRSFVNDLLLTASEAGRERIIGALDDRTPATRLCTRILRDD